MSDAFAEPVDWGGDGTPRSPRYGDVYRSAAGGLQQARQAFLNGCDLPDAWAGQLQWRILETGFGLGLNFLTTWHAWRQDPQRPRMLHFVSVEAHPVQASDLLRSARTCEGQAPGLTDLAQQLTSQWWGLMPGWHRLSFEGGQVLLSLGIGDACERLREQTFHADSVFLDGFDPQRNPRMWDTDTLHQVARLCRQGTRLGTWCVAAAVREPLRSMGFAVERVPGLPPKRHHLRARCVRPWAGATGTAAAPNALKAPSWPRPGRAMVIGAGIAGACTAAALARRGWQVQVLDAASEPAAGASGLPAGLFAPHVSPDDAPLSRLSRAGVRATRQALMQLLPHSQAQAWAADGVLERPIERVRQWPDAAHAGLYDTSRPATDADYQPLHDPQLSTAEPGALWHGRGGWMQPGALVRACLQQAGVQWQGNTTVAALRCDAMDPPRAQQARWTALDARGQALARADLVVVAAAYATQALCVTQTGSALHTAQAVQPSPPSDRFHPPHATALPLQPLRGQVTFGPMPPGSPASPFAVHGHGSVIAGVNLPMWLAGVPMWVAGSTFERGRTDTGVDADAHQRNLDRLRALAPGLADRIAARAAADAPVHGWAGVRATLPDRLPAVGPLSESAPAPWVLAGLGSRGLTLAPLAAELLCAWLHDEPLPVDRALATRLRASRFRR